MNLLDTIELNPEQPATASVIWLHGLGASANDFLPIVPQLKLPLDHTIRFIFPNAPAMPVTLNGGFPMPAWYDIYGLAGNARQDEAGIRKSEGLVQALLDKELRRGIKSERIVLAGFSQGGAMALHTGLRYPERLGGILALSTYLPLADMAANELIAAKDLPILMIHGSFDPVVKLEWAEFSRTTLQQLGYTIDWRAYPMAHSVCPEEIEQIVAWLTTQLP
jgi:phospholipase/carboxylesterase